MRPLLALLPLAMLALSPAEAADTVADKVFGIGLLDRVTSPQVLRYRYEMRGETIEQPIASPVTMAVRTVEPDGDKEVHFDLFEGPNHRQLGPMAARKQNPLVIVFLQRDVTAMGNLTGGAAGYFQQQIRRSFNEPAEVSTIEVELDGRRIPATRIVIHPFRDDPAIGRFPKFKDKAYEFVVAPEVPGGLYRVASSTPDEEGDVVLAESMTFERVEPITPGSPK